MNSKAEARLKKAMMKGMKEGYLSVPNLLLKMYRKLGLTDLQTMLILHIISFQQKEDKWFPTVHELQERMSTHPDEVIRALQLLVQRGWLEIQESEDENSIRYEWYDVDPLYEELCSVTIQDYLDETASLNSLDWLQQLDESSLFTTFEREFGRPLSPMECESMSQWVEQDGYSEELVLAALKEAVFAEKLSFRYIDRILLEWEKKGVKTAEQAKELAASFRNHQKGPASHGGSKSFTKPLNTPLYNWLERD